MTHTPLPVGHPDRPASGSPAALAAARAALDAFEAACDPSTWPTDPEAEAQAIDRQTAAAVEALIATIQATGVGWGGWDGVDADAER